MPPIAPCVRICICWSIHHVRCLLLLHLFVLIIVHSVWCLISAWSARSLIISISRPRFVWNAGLRMVFSCGVTAATKFVETEEWLTMNVMMAIHSLVMAAAQVVKFKPTIYAERSMVLVTAGAVRLLFLGTSLQLSEQTNLLLVYSVLTTILLVLSSLYNVGLALMWFQEQHQALKWSWL